MSLVVVKNGRNGNTMKVDSLNRAHTFGINNTEWQDAIKRGNAFIINTGLIELITDTISGLIYMKSNESQDIVIHELFVQSGTSTNGTTPDIIRTDGFVITGGTLVSNAVSAPVINIAGSPNTLEVTAYKGAEGDTVIALATAEGFFYAASSFDQLSGSIVPKGGTLAISATPPPSNTSMKIAITVFLYKQAVAT